MKVGRIFNICGLRGFWRIRCYNFFENLNETVVETLVIANDAC